LDPDPGAAARVRALIDAEDHASRVADFVSERFDLPDISSDGVADAVLDKVAVALQAPTKREPAEAELRSELRTTVQQAVREALLSPPDAEAVEKEESAARTGAPPGSFDDGVLAAIVRREIAAALPALAETLRGVIAGELRAQLVNLREEVDARIAFVTPAPASPPGPPAAHEVRAVEMRRALGLCAGGAPGARCPRPANAPDELCVPCREATIERDGGIAQAMQAQAQIERARDLADDDGPVI
jgi:hypothetical protein